MKIRMKKRGAFGIKKIALDGKINRIERGDGMHVFIKGIEGLGLLSFSVKEMEMIEKKLKTKKIVVKRKTKKK